jgi:hypothetical protein
MQRVPSTHTRTHTRAGGRRRRRRHVRHAHPEGALHEPRRPRRRGREVHRRRRHRARDAAARRHHAPAAARGRGVGVRVCACALWYCVPALGCTLRSTEPPPTCPPHPPRRSPWRSTRTPAPHTSARRATASTSGWRCSRCASWGLAASGLVAWRATLIIRSLGQLSDCKHFSVFEPRCETRDHHQTDPDVCFTASTLCTVQRQLCLYIRMSSSSHPPKTFICVNPIW